MTTHNESVQIDSISTSHVIRLSGGGVKVITYISAAKVEDILAQLSKNGGQISDITAKALGHSIASALAKDEREYRAELAANEYRFSDPDYDIEESDDDRTTWPPDEEEPEV